MRASERGRCQNESMSRTRSWVLPLGPGMWVVFALSCWLKRMCSSSDIELWKIVRRPPGFWVITASVWTGRITRSSVSLLMIRPSFASISMLAAGRTSNSGPI